MRVGWNVWGSAFCTVSHLWRNAQPSFASNFHTLNANVPTFDDLTGAKSKLEGFAFETRVKYCKRNKERIGLGTKLQIFKNYVKKGEEGVI